MCDIPDNICFGARPEDKAELETTETFCPKFDDKGLIPCITTDAGTGEVLMFAFMNDIALAKTIETGYVHLYSRSRQKLWRKGESSGMVQKVEEILTDCDQDAIVLKVTVAEGKGGAKGSCHVGYNNCFYRAISIGSKPKEARLTVVQEKVYDPSQVYG